MQFTFNHTSNQNFESYIPVQDFSYFAFTPASYLDRSTTTTFLETTGRGVYKNLVLELL